MSVRRLISTAALIILTLALTAIAAGCGGGDGAGTEEVEVVLSGERQVEASSLTASKGRVTFVVQNEAGGGRGFAIFPTNSSGELHNTEPEGAVTIVDISGQALEEVVVELEAGTYVLASWPTGEGLRVDWDGNEGFSIDGSATIEVR